MDKSLHPLYSVGWNYLSIPKLQWYSCWSLAMDKQFHPTLYWAYDYWDLLIHTWIKSNLWITYHSAYICIKKYSHYLSISCIWSKLFLKCFNSLWPVDAIYMLSEIFVIIVLTHWGRDKMAAIFQATFSTPFSWMKKFELRFKFHWDLFLRVQLTIFQHWFR